MKFFSVFLVLLGIFSPLVSGALMEGGDFQIYGDTFSTFQGDSASAGDFTLYSSGGEFFATSTQGGDFTLKGGFQALEIASLSLSVSPNSVSLGELSLSQVKSASTVVRVTTDAATGYALTATENGNLRKGAGGGVDDINDVLDGEVSVGAEEYGVTTSGGGGILNTDQALSGTLTLAQSQGEVTNQETTVTFKASVGPQSRAGNYSHTVTFTLTANP